MICSFRPPSNPAATLTTDPPHHHTCWLQHLGRSKMRAFPARPCSRRQKVVAAHHRLGTTAPTHQLPSILNAPFPLGEGGWGLEPALSLPKGPSKQQSQNPLVRCISFTQKKRIRKNASSSSTSL